MKKILMVDDDALVCRLFNSKFEFEGYLVEVCTDGLSAIEAVQKNAYDLVLLDLMLPKANGVEVLVALRDRGARRDTPVVVFSNSQSSALVQSAWQAGADRCLTKTNCTPRQLIEVVRALLQSPGVAVPASSPLPPAAEGPQQTTAPAPEPLLQPEPGPRQQRQIFLGSATVVLAALRARIQTVMRQPALAGQVLAECAEAAHSVIAGAGHAACPAVAQVCAAFERLCRELIARPQNMNASSLRTLAVAADLLGQLLQQEQAPAAPENGRIPLVLAVDDDLICRRTIRTAVDKVGFCLITVADAAAALTLLAENRFDLVLSDVNMPGTNGFDFCAQLRKLPNGHAVPVIFITSLSDFETRTRYALAGGSDFVAKPFSLTELSLRALCCVFKSRLTRVPVSQIAAPAVQITHWNTESYAPAIHALA